MKRRLRENMIDSVPTSRNPIDALNPDSELARIIKNVALYTGGYGVGAAVGIPAAALALSLSENVNIDKGLRNSFNKMNFINEAYPHLSGRGQKALCAYMLAEMANAGIFNLVETFGTGALNYVDKMVPLDGRIRQGISAVPASIALQMFGHGIPVFHQLAAVQDVFGHMGNSAYYSVFGESVDYILENYSDKMSKKQLFEKFDKYLTTLSEWMFDSRQRVTDIPFLDWAFPPGEPYKNEEGGVWRDSEGKVHYHSPSMGDWISHYTHTVPLSAASGAITTGTASALTHNYLGVHGPHDLHPYVFGTYYEESYRPKSRSKLIESACSKINRDARTRLLRG